MIAFACRQCGKRFEQPDAAANSLVYCDCGTANRVPWESTLPLAAEPLAVPVAPPEPLPPVVSWGPEWHAPRGWEAASQALPALDPAVCFNHPGAPRQHTCAACQLSFCADCVVTLKSEVLCGPCKNYRLRTLQAPARVSLLAIFAAVVGLLAGGVWCIVMLIALGSHATPATFRLLGGLGLLPQVIAFTLGGLALHTVETESRVAGREWAITGMVAAVASSCFFIALALFGGEAD